MKRHFPSLLLVAALVLSACQKSPKPRSTAQELHLNLHSEPPTLDPRKATDTVSIAVIRMCFEGLTTLDEQGNAIPALAEKIDRSEDGLTYTFYLRDAKWSDGQPILASDFEETLKTALSPNFSSPFASDLYVIKNAKKAKEGLLPAKEIGVTVINPKVLQIQLDHPVPYFPELASTTCYLPVPQHIIKNHPYFANHAGPLLVTSGPFKIKEWKHYNEINLEKNEHYWDASVVKLERISLWMVEDQSAELALFDRGELDWVGGPLSSLSLEALPTLTDSEYFQRYRMAAVYFYLFNIKVFPFNNVNIRRAFALAIDRHDIVQNILQGGQLPAMSLLPPTMAGFGTGYFKDADLVEARRLFEIGLKELGVTAEEISPITLSYNTLQAHHKIAQAIQQQWYEAFGVDVRLENKEWKVFIDEVHRHQFQVARLGGVAPINDPTAFLDSYRYPHDPNNYCQWVNPLYSEKLALAELALDKNERLQYLREAEELLIDDMPIIPIYFYTSSYLKKPYVHNVGLTASGDMILKGAYVERK